MKIGTLTFWFCTIILILATFAAGFIFGLSENEKRTIYYQSKADSLYDEVQVCKNQITIIKLNPKRYIEIK